MKVLMLTRFIRTTSLVLLLLMSATTAAALSAETMMAWDEEQYEHAARLLERTLQEMPNDADTMALLAEAYWRDGQAKKAQETLEKLFKLRQDQANDYYLFGRVLSERVNEVSVFKKLSYAGRIREAFEQALALDPMHVKAMLALVVYHISAPGIAGGDRDVAVELSERLKTVNPTAGLRAEMLLLFADEKDQQAYEKAEQLLAMKPGDVSTLFYLTVQEMNQKNYAEAVKLIEQAREADDLDQLQQLRGLWYQLGKAASESGMWLEEGKAALERYLSLHNYHAIPPKAWAYFRLAQVYQHLDDANQVQHYLQLAEQENKIQDDDELDDLLKAERKRLRRG